LQSRGHSLRDDLRVLALDAAATPADRFGDGGRRPADADGPVPARGARGTGGSRARVAGLGPGRAADPPGTGPCPGRTGGRPEQRTRGQNGPARGYGSHDGPERAAVARLRTPPDPDHIPTTHPRFSMLYEGDIASPAGRFVLVAARFNGLVVDQLVAG